MLMVIDAGNTNIVLALYDGDTLRARWRIRTVAGRTADEYQSFCLPLLHQTGLSWADVTGIVLSSVIPAENFNLMRFCENHVGRAAISVKDPRLDLGLSINLENPAQVGADRLMNAIAAKALYPMSCVVVDFGTGTTFDVMDDAGAYCGGIIASGVHLSLEALHRVSAKLPNIDIVRPAKVCGTDTISAMQSGIYHGYLAMVDGLVGKLSAERGGFKTVVATGGLASLFAAESTTITDVNGDLTLTGLRLVAERNKDIVYG